MTEDEFDVDEYFERESRRESLAYWVFDYLMGDSVPVLRDYLLDGGCSAPYKVLREAHARQLERFFRKYDKLEEILDALTFFEGSDEDLLRALHREQALMKNHKRGGRFNQVRNIVECIKNDLADATALRLQGWNPIGYWVEHARCHKLLSERTIYRIKRRLRDEKLVKCKRIWCAFELPKFYKLDPFD